MRRFFFDFFVKNSTKIVWFSCTKKAARSSALCAMSIRRQGVAPGRRRGGVLRRRPSGCELHTASVRNTAPAEKSKVQQKRMGIGFCRRHGIRAEMLAGQQ